MTLIRKNYSSEKVRSSMRIRVDYNNMLASAGAANGVTAEELEGMLPRLGEALASANAECFYVHAVL